MKSLRQRPLLTLSLLACVGIVGDWANAQVSPGALAEAHRHLDEATQCFACHGGGRNSPELNQRCADCHTEISWQLRQKVGLHGRESLVDCTPCHPDHAGRDFDLIEWAEGKAEEFEHRRAGWTLVGAHQSLDCRECHQPKFQTAELLRLMQRENLAESWLGLESSCSSCHTDAHRGSLGAACENCHAQSAWSPAPQFDHDKSSFRLDGRHQAVACDGCHKQQQPQVAIFAPLAHRECSSCHQDVHNGRFGAECSSCHTTASFEAVRLDRFDHSQTSFPLRAKHRGVDCSSCHDPAKDGYKRSEGTSCGSCHSDAHAGRARWQGSQADCSTCHDERGFSPSILTARDHATTSYPLEGAHLRVACSDCHSKFPAGTVKEDLGSSRVLLQPKYADCRDCHEESHADQLKHRADDGACDSCHTVDSFSPSTFGRPQHDELNFTLSGAHLDAKCQSCHGPQRPLLAQLPSRELLGAAGVLFSPMEIRCADCHYDPHAGELEQSCEACHSTGSFRPSLVDAEMHASLGSRLNGAHRTVACFACHDQLLRPPRKIQLLRAEDGSSLTFGVTGTDCVSCHSSPHEGRFGVREPRCADCHDESQFVPVASFDHTKNTEFPLLGEHRDVPCTSCHERADANGLRVTVYRPIPTDCRSCHGAAELGEISP